MLSVESHAADLELLRAAALEAGTLAMSYFKRSPNRWSKAGGSLVTEADMAVDRLLHGKLLAARPGYGWLSEEIGDSPARLSSQTIFVVDPIDGTKDFIAGGNSWCVSLAIVEAGRPTVAVLYAPAREELLEATRGGGCWRRGERLSVNQISDMKGARLSGPRSWMRSAAFQRMGVDIQERIPSLAYRIASVAAGRLDVAFASPGAHDWDLAACDLLVHEAGGRLAELGGKAPIYNQEIPRHGALAASNERLLPVALVTMGEAARDVARGKRT